MRVVKIIEKNPIINKDEYLGICGVNQCYSDMMTFSDCDCRCEATEYKEVQTITYKLKK